MQQPPVLIKYKNKTLDATRFLPYHPGGIHPLIMWEGMDVTDVFMSMHGPESRAHKMVEHLPVVHEADEDECNTSLVQMAFRELAVDLHADMKQRGTRIWCTMWWLFEFMLVGAIFGVGCGVLAVSNKDWANDAYRLAGYGIAALCFGIGFMQLGWFSHDIAHKQVVTKPWLLKPLVWIVGNVMAGYSYDWWRVKHNTMHHPGTNVIGVDEDIDTMPLLAWDAKLVERKWHLQFQHLYVWPLLAFARLMWRWRSLCHVVSRRMYGEIAGLVVHYAVYGLAALWLCHYMSALEVCAFVLAVEMIGGFGTAFVFIQSHNAKDVVQSVGHMADYWTHQLRTTTNITPSFWSNFMSGYLNMQIEHHLFPWLPRRLLPVAREKVRDLCLRYALPYREFSWGTSTRLIYRHLKQVGLLAQCRQCKE